MGIAGARCCNILERGIHSNKLRLQELSARKHSFEEVPRLYDNMLRAERMGVSNKTFDTDARRTGERYTINIIYSIIELYIDGEKGCGGYQIGTDEELDI